MPYILNGTAYDSVSYLAVADTMKSLRPLLKAPMPGAACLSAATMLKRRFT